MGFLASQRRLERVFRTLREKLRTEVANAVARVEKTHKPTLVRPMEGRAEVPDVSDDVVLLIASAATSYLGKSVRVRSVKSLEDNPEHFSAWAQQGRAFLHASHNIAQRAR